MIKQEFHWNVAYKFVPCVTNSYIPFYRKVSTVCIEKDVPAWWTDNERSKLESEMYILKSSSSAVLLLPSYHSVMQRKLHLTKLQVCTYVVISFSFFIAYKIFKQMPLKSLVVERNFSQGKFEPFITIFFVPNHNFLIDRI